MSSSDLKAVTERKARKAAARKARVEREGVKCNCCCSDPETNTPGCMEDSCNAIFGKCPNCGKKKVAPEGVAAGSPPVQKMTRGGKKTHKKRRRKRRKTRKKRRKTKRKKRRKKKKSRRRRK